MPTPPHISGPDTSSRCPSVPSYGGSEDAYTVWKGIKVHVALVNVSGIMKSMRPSLVKQDYDRAVIEAVPAPLLLVIGSGTQLAAG